MAFVRTIPPSDAEGAVREMYEETHRQLGRRRLPAASSASSWTPWAFRPTRPSPTSTRLCGRRWRWGAR